MHIAGLLVLAISFATDLLLSPIEFDDDSSRDLIYGLDAAMGHPLPKLGPSVNQLGMYLGPHWYAFVSALLRISTSTGTLLTARWALQMATVALFFVFVRRLYDDATAWVAAVFLASSRILAEVFSWYTHPMLAMPLAAGTLVALERWVTTRRPWFAVAAATLAGLALQTHFACAVLLPMSALTALFAGQLPARWAAATSAALLSTFFPAVSQPGAQLLDRQLVSSPSGVELNLVPPFALLVFLWLWRGGHRTGWRRHLPGATALGLLLLWLGVTVSRVDGRPIAGWSLFNVRMAPSGVPLSQTDWGSVLGRLLHLLVVGPVGREGEASARFVLAALLLVAGAALVAFQSLCSSGDERRRARLLLSWLTVIVPVVLLTCRDGAASRYLMVAVLLCSLVIGALVTRLWRWASPPPLAELSVRLATVAVLLYALRNAPHAWHSLEKVGTARWFSPCDRGMLQSQQLYERLLMAGLSPTEIGSRVHGIYGPGQQGLLQGSFAFIRAVLDDLGAPPPSLPLRAFRLVEPLGGHDCSERSEVETFEPALDLERVRVSPSDAGEPGGTVALPMRRPPLVALRTRLLQDLPLGNAANDLQFELSRRPGHDWPARIEMFALGRPSGCVLETDAPGAAERPLPANRPGLTRLELSNIPSSLERLTIRTSNCRLEHFDAWDAAVR